MTWLSEGSQQPCILKYDRYNDVQQGSRSRTTDLSLRKYLSYLFESRSIMFFLTLNTRMYIAISMNNRP